MGHSKKKKCAEQRDQGKQWPGDGRVQNNTGSEFGRACLCHLLMYSGKARDAHQGSGRVGNLLDVGLKLVPSDRQGSIQVRAL